MVITSPGPLTFAEKLKQKQLQPSQRIDNHQNELMIQDKQKQNNKGKYQLKFSKNFHLHFIVMIV